VGDISLETEVNSKSAKEKPSINTATVDKAAAQKSSVL
jgi:hypothetical protein